MAIFGRSFPIKAHFKAPPVVGEYVPLNYPLSVGHASFTVTTVFTSVVYDPIFDRVEDTCPQLFFPRRPVTQEFHYWSRMYHMGSEMQLLVDEVRVKYFWYLHGGDPIDIGSFADWQAGRLRFDCSVRTSPAVIHFKPSPL